MSIPKLLLIGAVVLFSGIGVMAVSKGRTAKKVVENYSNQASAESSVPLKTLANPEPVEKLSPKVVAKEGKVKPIEGDDLPNIDRIFQLFTTTGSSKLPIVETVEYSSSVSWLKGRPAWISDYAVYYNTSKHFIARSLNGGPDYFSQKVSSGSRFNVLKKDKKIEFHLVADVSRCKLAFYYLDLETHERVLLKVYRVGLGRLDPSKPSGILTPLGTYQLGDKIAAYAPGVTGLFHEQKTEMIRVFGSRWIPFGQEIEDCTEPSRGYGIHGAPWVVNPKTGALVENKECIGKYESDGCIRLLLEDMEELYSIVVTKPTFIHIMKDFHDKVLPGVEVASPTR